MNSYFKNNQETNNRGYTLVELLVALAVSAIVVSGTLAGYTVFAKQYDVLNKKIEMDRDVLKVIDLIQSDVAMAGYKFYRSDITFNPSQSITLTSSSDLLLQVHAQGTTNKTVAYRSPDSQKFLSQLQENDFTRAQRLA